jgi:hypothetical protein
LQYSVLCSRFPHKIHRNSLYLGYYTCLKHFSMSFLIVIVRIPFGLLAAFTLLGWALMIVFPIYCIFFVIVSVFSKKSSLEDVTEKFMEISGVGRIPGVFRWVFSPASGIDS